MKQITKPITAWLNIKDTQITAIGNQMQIPLEIESQYQWESATIEFNITSPDKKNITSQSIVIDPVTLTEKQQVPLTTSIFVTIKEEGFFDVEGKLRIKLKAEEVKGKAELELTDSIHIGFFAFQGKYIAGYSAQAALEHLAQYNLTQQDSEASKLINKAIKNRLAEGSSNLLDEEEKALARFIFEERLQIEKIYFEKYPSPIKRAITRNLNLKKDQVVTIRVNWPISRTANGKVLPLDGAEIELSDNDTIFPSKINGTLVEGEFSFTVPKDNYDFTATVTAKYGDKFSVSKEGMIFDTVVTTIFKNQTTYTITDGSAWHWSVFQAVVDLTNIAKKELSFTRDDNRKIYVEVSGKVCFYHPSNKAIYIVPNRSFDWDVIAHEFGHAIANETASTYDAVGGEHSGENQYDYSNNTETLKNKEKSISLAFSEGYGTWIGVALLKSSSYIGDMPTVGDSFYTTTNSDGTTSLNIDLELNETFYKSYGEDTEDAISNLLWDLYDDKNEDNSRAHSKLDAKDSITYSLGDLFNNVFRGNKLKNISDFYDRMFFYHTQKDVNYFNGMAEGSSITNGLLNKVNQLGTLFAEFGIAPNIDDTVEQTSNKLIWSHLKTGTMPGHDGFDIFFFNNGKHKLLYKKVGITPDFITKPTNETYQYILQKDDIDKLEEALKDEQSTLLYVLIKATASGATADKGQIPTGPYFSNLASFEFIKSKKTVIAVDSSGSNTWNDPGNLRINAAHKILNNQDNRNKDIFDELFYEKEEKTIKTIAMDFDTQVTWLSDMTWPNELYDRKIFNAIDSYGGTNIADAIYQSRILLATRDSNSNIVVPAKNTHKNILYLLTDMEDNASAVKTAMKAAQNDGIRIYQGLLQPPTQTRIADREMNGDSVNNSRIWEPFDDIIEIILESGGSYAVIEDAASQEAWADLVNYLERYEPEDIVEIALPINIRFYWLGYENRNSPTFFITPESSGELTITVDSKGSFVPNLQVNDKGIQTALGNDLYELKIKVVAGLTYAVTLNKPLADTGLYSIIAKFNKSKEIPSICDGSLITTGAALRDGNVYVWGFRGSAQQGNGVKVVKNNAQPEKVANLSNVVQLATGAYHLLALDINGDVWGWGQNIYGEAGSKDTYVTIPQKVLSNAIQLATGEYFSIALDENGNVWSWGHNLYGQLGNGTKTNSKTPVMVNLQGEKARLIGGAYEGAFAVTEEGHVWAWGDNEASGLGFQGSNYGVQKIITSPTRVPNLDVYAERITYIAGGNGWGEALLDDGTVIGWGLRASLGVGVSKTNVSSPVPVTIMENVQQLFARYVGSFALTNEGKLFTWGQTTGSAFKMIYGDYASLRSGTHSPVVRIGGGKEHLFYETEDGKLYGVGYNDLYKLNQSKLGGIINWPGSEILIP